MKRIRITVTAEDIALGACQRYYSGRANSCPLAQALRRRFPKAYGIAVGFEKASVHGAVGGGIFDLSPAAKDFIRRADHHEEGVKPATFVLTDRYAE